MSEPVLCMLCGHIESKHGDNYTGCFVRTSIAVQGDSGTFCNCKKFVPLAPVLFLDIDGVLNGHDFDEEAGSCTIRRRCVDELNRVLKATRCAIVISSAWRYMIHGGAMNLDGFAYLLRTHGVRCMKGIVGITRKDRNVSDPHERGQQIREWLKNHPRVARWAVVDDMQLGFDAMPIVRTDGQVGLTPADADALIALLCAA